MSEKKGITFEEIEKIASDMLSNGITPTVRGVISVTGGKTQVVSKYLRDFFEKRDTEVSIMANEIGSTNVAKIIASEIHSIVDKRTFELTDVNVRQKEQIDELVELLEEKEKETDKVKKESAQSIEIAKNEATQKIEKILLETSNKIKKIEIEIQSTIEDKQQAEKESSETKIVSLNATKASREQADALVDAANKRASQAEHESKLLREQVKSLSIDEATRDIEKAEYEKIKQLLEQMRFEYAEQKTEVVKATVQNQALTKDIKRLEDDNQEYKHIDKELTKSQTQLLESQKTILELNSKLSLSERERESLSSALNHQKIN